MIPAGEKAVPSNLSAVYTPAWQETLIGGVLQGRKQFDPRGASAICRRSLWKVAAQVVGFVGLPMLGSVLRKRRYGNVKGDEVFNGRKRVKEDVKKEGLKGWVRNDGDDGFELEC
jgi:tRNA-specific adenosine deaminase 1